MEKFHTKTISIWTAHMDLSLLTSLGKLEKTYKEIAQHISLYGHFRIDKQMRTDIKKMIIHGEHAPGLHDQIRPFPRKLFLKAWHLQNKVRSLLEAHPEITITKVRLTDLYWLELLYGRHNIVVIGYSTHSHGFLRLDSTFKDHLARYYTAKAPHGEHLLHVTIRLIPLPATQ